MTNDAIITEGLTHSNLDESQKAFCSSSSQALRLLAPAGSGKTYSLLWRCLNLSEAAGKQNLRFLIFTFTLTAKDELRDRVKNDPVFAKLQPYISFTTLNSWGFRLLKNKKHNLRLCVNSQEKYFCMNNLLQPVWSTYPTISSVLTSSKTSVRASKLLMDLLDKLKGLGFRHDVHTDIDKFTAHVDWLKDSGMKPHILAIFKSLQDIEIIQADFTTQGAITEVFVNFFPFWIESCQRMYDSSMITLEDQKYWSLIELGKELDEAKYTTGKNRFHHVMVDEFQDINTLDLNLLKNIADLNKSQLTIIGDDDQAIYEWRGATTQFILEPDKHINSGYGTCTLEVNYRSPKNIVEYSQRLIKHNKNRVDKDIRAHSDSSADISALFMPTLSASVEYVLSTVKEVLANTKARNIAIIGRKRSQIIPYQIIFASEDIPFYAAEDLQVFLSGAFNELKGMLAIKARADTPFIGVDVIEDFLKLCDKVKRYPLKKTDRGELKNFLVKKQPKKLLDALQALYNYQGHLKGDNKGGKMSETFYEAIRPLLVSETVAESLEVISTNFDGLQKDYGKSLEDVFYADPPFIYLSEYAERYGNDYVGFYNDIEKAVSTLVRLPSELEESAQADESWKAPVHLMTALRAKGKEYDVVIILDANEGIWPNMLAETADQLEAERRVFYVAFTRAKQRLVLLVNDSMLGESAAPSPYLAEMGLNIESFSNT